MTKPVAIKNLTIGGNNRILIQSMLSCNTLDSDAVFAQIDSLVQEGCDIIRLAVENEEAVKISKKYIEKYSVPLVADIHFDYKLAIACSEAGFSKIRINPGNIGGEEKLKQVISACKKNKTVIRLGVNGGSLEKDIREEFGSASAQALAKSALRNIKVFEEYGFEDLVVSIKSSCIKTTIQANRILSQACKYPLHIGITETGSKEMGTIKSAIGIGSLLVDGIGDTIRVSLTDSPVQEVIAAKKILKALNLLDHIEIISCPTCSRCKYDLINIADKLYDYTKNIKKKIKIAVMGCVVNGPGEAMDADFGVAGGGEGKAVIFKKGQIISTIESSNALEVLKQMIDGF